MRHGSDPFWPAIIAESTSATFEVLFIEAQTDERDYECGTVNRSSLRWSSFNEGLESCRGGEPLYRSWDERRGVFETISAVAAMRGFQCRILGATTSVVPICEENCEEKDLSLHAARGSEIQDVSVRIPPMPSRHPSCSGVGHTPI